MTEPLDATPTQADPRIVYCHCAYANVVPKEVKSEVLRRLTDSGVSFEAVPDLCEFSARRDPSLKDLTQGGPVKIAACYPRAVKWLFSAAGIELPAEVEVLNMRTDTAEDVARRLGLPMLPSESVNGS